MGDRLDVGETIPAFYEESLIVLESVRRSDHCVVQAIGVVVLDHFPHALLEIGCGNDLTIFRRWQSDATHFAARRLDHQVRHVEKICLELFGGERKLASPVVAEFRHHAANRFVASMITVGALQDWSDVLGRGFDAHVIRDHSAKAKTVRIALVFGHEDTEHLTWPECTCRERDTDGAVYAATQSDHVPFPPEIDGEVAAECVYDSLGRSCRIEC